MNGNVVNGKNQPAKPSCYNMECVFVNYPKTICYIGSEMGPCPPGMNNFAFNLGTEANQVDYFDAIMGRPGTYIIPAGQIPVRRQRQVLYRHRVVRIRRPTMEPDLVVR